MRGKTIQEIREEALKTFTKSTYTYFESGADDEETLSENNAAFDRIFIRQHSILDNVNNESSICDSQNNAYSIQTSVNLLGDIISTPICIAPTGIKKIAHPDGDRGAAIAARDFGTCICVSTSYCVSSETSFEDLRNACPDGLLWLQLYIYRDRNVTRRIVKQAEDFGFKAIVLTVDATAIGFRIAHLRKKKTEHDRKNNTSSQINTSKSDYNLNFGAGAALFSHVTKNYESNLSWDLVTWLRSFTKLPILLKGVLSYEDALDCLKYGIQGILVSNHGGRQLDCVPSTIEALPEVVRAVQGKIPVFLDGGIRRGSDVFKALALGAKAVFVGRPIIYGLACDGTKGAKNVLDVLTQELRETMEHTGCRRLEDINRCLVVHKNSYGIAEERRRLNRNWTPNPNDILCIDDIRESARLKNYDEQNDLAFVPSFSRYLIRPRVLQGIVGEVDTSLCLFDQHFPLPVVMSTQCRGNIKMFEAVQEASKTFNVCFAVDAEDLKNMKVKPHSRFLMTLQQNWFDDVDALGILIKNATSKGCIALLVPATSTSFLKDRINKLKTITSLPVIVKEILGVQDAFLCCRLGVQGMILTKDSMVSRGLTVVEDIVRITKNNIPLFYEGNVRKGTDIFKMVALGVKAIFIDQTLMWGYEHAGVLGMKTVMSILRDEFKRAMTLAGCAAIKNVTSSMVLPHDYYWALIGGLDTCKQSYNSNL